MGTNYDDILETPSPGFVIEQVADHVYNLYGLTGKLSPLDSERDQNLRIETKDGDKYVIKIANRAENPATIDMQLKALEHIALVDPALPVPRIMLSKNGSAIEQIQAKDGVEYSVRIISFLEGEYPEGVPTDFALNRPIGRCLAQLGLALRGFFHPAANHDLLWDIKHTSKLRQLLPYIEDEDHHELVAYFLDRFDQNVLPIIPKLRAQIIHNDLNS